MSGELVTHSDHEKSGLTYTVYWNSEEERLGLKINGIEFYDLPRWPASHIDKIRNQQRNYRFSAVYAENVSDKRMICAYEADWAAIRRAAGGMPDGVSNEERKAGEDSDSEDD